jgi:hypothetical protein
MLEVPDSTRWCLSPPSPAAGNVLTFQCSSSVMHTSVVCECQPSWRNEVAILFGNSDSAEFDQCLHTLWCCLGQRRAEAYSNIGHAMSWAKPARAPAVPVIERRSMEAGCLPQGDTCLLNSMQKGVHETSQKQGSGNARQTDRVLISMITSMPRTGSMQQMQCKFVCEPSQDMMATGRQWALVTSRVV